MKKKSTHITFLNRHLLGKNNDGKETTHSQMHKVVVLFRAIHLLTINLNSFHQKYMSIVKMLALIGISTTSLFAVIRLSSVLLWQEILVYCMAALESFIAIIFCIGAMASVYSTSNFVMQNCGGVVRFQRNGWFRRHYTSWQVLCVKLGSVNYIDRYTPLVLLETAVEELVNLLLL